LFELARNHEKREKRGSASFVLFSQRARNRNSLSLSLHLLGKIFRVDFIFRLRCFPEQSPSSLEPNHPGTNSRIPAGRGKNQYCGVREESRREEKKNNKDPLAQWREQLLYPTIR